MLDGREILDRTFEARDRFEFALEVKKIELNVEKVVVKNESGERVMLSASTAEYGPAGYSITWGFLANLALMVSQYAIPFNRIANMLTSPEKKFTSGMMTKYYNFVAKGLVPVYLELFRNLSNADIISGDDTSNRVIEVSRYFANKPEGPPESQQAPPWIKYVTKKASLESLESGETSLGATIGSELGFVSNLRNRDGIKKSFQTSTMSGRSISDDPRSTILFYRSHFGGFGNLLEELLSSRLPKFRKLWIQADFSQVNLIVNEELLKRFDVTYAGCACHARRPFSIFEHDDPDNCSYMLHLFKGLYIHEQGLDLYGRNEENTIAVRGIDSKALWDDILELASSMTKQWSPKTELGRACSYIIRHFDKLTAYLKNPRLGPDNNFSERALRLEKMIEASALFRQSLEGRFALDVVRTVVQTAIMAKVDVQKYLIFVLRAGVEKVSENPQLYTPLAFAMSQTDMGPQ
jgi:hypothetical protein